MLTFLVGCDIPVSSSDDRNIEQYVLPTLPGPIVEYDGVASIEPVLLNDHLANPGMGWQDGPEPFGFMNFPETVSYSNRREIAWSVLNPAEDLYDWSALNEQMESAIRDGKQFSFRVYTFVGEGFDGHMIPEWVLDLGAGFLPSGEPDYSNCIYQEKWGRFVNEMVRKYDGDPDIAFIDISGYGNFSEWSWQDSQTEWDEQWNTNYSSGSPSASDFLSLDGQARRRLVDMFIGGSFQGHACRMPDGGIAQVDYSYKGFQKTQLVMPYAGIVQSTQYVLYRRSDVGFRHDCLGREAARVYEKVGGEIDRIWPNAPVVFELCKPDEMDINEAETLLQLSHGSIVHNNNWAYSYGQLEDMMSGVGYRYFLKKASTELKGRNLLLKMEWQNLGSAPNYPKMGQDFKLFFYLVSYTGRQVFKTPIRVDVHDWLPGIATSGENKSYHVSENISLPIFLVEDRYLAGISIIDARTKKPINLPFGAKDSNGITILFPIKMK